MKSRTDFYKIRIFRPSAATVKNPTPEKADHEMQTNPTAAFSMNLNRRRALAARFLLPEEAIPIGIQSGRRLLTICL